MKKRADRLLTIFAIVASVLIVAYLLAYPDMSDIQNDSRLEGSRE